MPESFDAIVGLLVAALVTSNQILVTGVAITTLALVIYTTTFNLKEWVARSFAGLLLAVTIIYVADVFGQLTAEIGLAELWTRLQWAGLAFVPALYVEFSDRLLATTGQPSRGRRVGVKVVYYVLAGVWALLMLATDLLVSGVEVTARYQRPIGGSLLWLFALYYAIGVGFSLYTIYRAYRRCLTSVTRNRMLYLLIAGSIPPIGLAPFLVLISQPLTFIGEVLFWNGALISNFLVGTALVIMAYSVSFFGAPQPDRVIKSRLFNWLLRGPIVTSTVVAAMVITGRLANLIGIGQTVLVPSVAVLTLLAMQFGITIFRGPLERLLFLWGRVDRDDVRRAELLSERLLTAEDVREFLEMALAAACDVVRVPSGFIASVGEARVRFEVRIGPDRPPQEQVEKAGALDQMGLEATDQPGIFLWHGFWVLPLHEPSDTDSASEIQPEMLGLLGLKTPADRTTLTATELHTLGVLARRAANALSDRRAQRQVLTVLDDLLPQVDRLQRIRAAARYSATETLTTEEDLTTSPDLPRWVKDALSHYWGGPSLSNSPLLGLRVVAQAQAASPTDNPANALRTVLRRAIDQTRPTEDQRKFTGEWLLYNILEMKFLQNRRVRDVALRLSMSEADLYRKQRVAIDQIAQIIADMEREAAESAQMSANSNGSGYNEEIPDTAST